MKMKRILLIGACLSAVGLFWWLQNHRQSSPRSLAEVALSHQGDTRYEAARWNGWYRPGSNKCNQAVADWIVASGHPRPHVPGHFGIIPRDPNAHEWADPHVTIPGWSAPFPRDQSQPGDIIAQWHGPVFGHVGVVVGIRQTISAYGEVQPPGLVLENDWRFRTAPGANGEGSADPPPIVRRYTGH